MPIDRAFMSATEDALVGGRFELVRPLKCGQGVETHLALDRSSGQRVVVKLVVAGEVTATVRLRLQHEAEVLGRLGGATPGVHLELGHHGDQLYLAQPFVPGVTLRERLAAGRLPTVEALRVAADVLSTLEAAHG